MAYDHSPDQQAASDERKEARGGRRTPEVPSPTGWSSWFGGPNVTVGPRIGPVLSSISIVSDSDSEQSSAAILDKQLAAEQGHAIQYRTCSWQKTAGLLFSEYICLAMMSFPWSYSVLGLVPGLILTVVVALIVLYTSLVLWEFCLRHPEVRDICDIGQMLFWNKRWAWWATAVMFILNNTFIQALHVLVGAEYLNTMTEADSVGCRTVSFGIVVAIICWFCSLPRTFDMLSKLGTASAFFTFVSVLLAVIFAAVQSHPAKYDPDVGGDPTVTAVPVLGTTFVSGLGAFLNISYTFIGQITLPSFIAEMRDPRDFPKALWACTIAEIVLFSIVGAVVYAYVGNQYMTAPAFGSLQPLFKKVSFSFMIPTIIFLGVLYASVSARFVFFRIFQNSRHKNEHTVVGWATWTSILMATWIVAFIIAQVIPFFSSLLSLMSSLFDSFFGFIFWGVAYFRMRRADGGIALVKEHTVAGYLLGALNVVIILIGVFFLTVGTYATVESIILEFENGTIRSIFSCASNGL
ncbi:amino-acid permease [Parathielavia appendiculata]|uniref:Amino-acid permease n=1 Tax=Parathielavia appendiculata TaxID=2587402 RepID=A0AAN6U166_9PEZI|nr:amino-acid permease [Parathielavia appendiculata]